MADIDFLTTRCATCRRGSAVSGRFSIICGPRCRRRAEALARLSVLCGPFRLDAAEAVGGASPEVLAALLDPVAAGDPGGRRFEVHELLRQYAAGHLAFDPDHDIARHAAYYLALLARHGGNAGAAGFRSAGPPCCAISIMCGRRGSGR